MEPVGPAVSVGRLLLVACEAPAQPVEVRLGGPMEEARALEGAPVPVQPAVPLAVVLV